MQPEALSNRIERQLAEQAGINAAVEVQDGRVRLNGMVSSAEDRLAAGDIARTIAPELRLDNQLEVEGQLPASNADIYEDEPSAGIVLESVEDIRERGGDIAPDFTDQSLLTDPVAAAGPSSSWEDPVAGGDDVYFPPTDPVVTTDLEGRTEVLGGFAASSMDGQGVARSAEDGRRGDEAIADAVRRELREDATTADLRVNVAVHGRIVHLRGQVDGMEDAENAEAVASRVPGVRAVDEELDVRQM